MIATTPTPQYNHPLELVHLVDQLADTAGVLPPEVVVVPFTADRARYIDDTNRVIELSYRAGRMARDARIDVPRAVLARFSPAAVRYLMAHEIAHLRVHRRGISYMVDRALNAVGWAAPFATLLALVFVQTSVRVFTTGLIIGLFAELGRYLCYLDAEIRADRYAVSLVGLDPDLVDELWDYTSRQTNMTWINRLRYRELHRLARQHTEQIQATRQTPPPPVAGVG